MFYAIMPHGFTKVHGFIIVGKGYSHGPRLLIIARKFTDIDDKYSSVIVDEVMVWDRVLSESEVIGLMNVYL